MAIPAEVAAINAEYQDQLPAPWRYYQLLNTIQPETDGPCCIPPMADNRVNACYPTNVTMETYTQYYDFIDLPRCTIDTTPANSMNCTDCHAVARPLGAPTFEDTPYPVPSYQVFTFMLSDAESSCPADLNYDGLVNGQDLAIKLADWGLSDTPADLNGDGVVNGEDITILLAAWGPCPTSGGSSGFRYAQDDRNDGVAVRRYLDTLERR